MTFIIVKNMNNYLKTILIVNKIENSYFVKIHSRNIYINACGLRKFTMKSK